VINFATTGLYTPNRPVLAIKEHRPMRYAKSPRALSENVYPKIWLHVLLHALNFIRANQSTKIFTADRTSTSKTQGPPD